MHEAVKPEDQRVRRSPVSISFGFATLRPLQVFRRIWKRPYRVLPQMWVKSRKMNVSGVPSHFR